MLPLLKSRGIVCCNAAPALATRNRPGSPKHHSLETLQCVFGVSSSPNANMHTVNWTQATSTGNQEIVFQLLASFQLPHGVSSAWAGSTSFLCFQVGTYPRHKLPTVQETQAPAEQRHIRCRDKFLTLSPWSINWR